MGQRSNKSNATGERASRLDVHVTAVVQAGGREELRVEAEIREGRQQVPKHQLEELRAAQRALAQAGQSELEVFRQRQRVKLRAGSVS
jgi:hypothetical protein